MEEQQNDTLKEFNYKNEIEINNYLNSSNIWTNRLLGFEFFEKNRTVDEVNYEYDICKYLPLLNSSLSDINKCKKLEFKMGGIKDKIFISKNNKIYYTNFHNTIQDYYNNLTNIIKRYTVNTLCELGCGYGYNLSLYSGKVCGGEYSKNAIKLGQRFGYDIKYFNYYDASTYDVIKPHSTILTSHSLEQIPDAQIFIKNIMKYIDNIDYIIHLEPTYINTRSDLLGLCRNKYIELNDYNKNIVTCIQNVNDSDIVEYHEDVFSLNPLNATNLIVWKINV